MLAKKKGSEFADCMVSHFGKLAKLTPLFNKYFKIKE
jgi:hypothetical protein